MKKSIYLEKYEQDIKEMQQQRKKNSNMTLVVLLVMIVLFAAAIFSTGAGQSSAGIIALLPLVLVVVLISSKNEKRDDAKKVRDDFARILYTDELVDEFDREMSSAPLAEMPLKHTGEKIFFTEHYVVTIQKIGVMTYRFARRSEVAKTDFIMMRNRYNGFKREYSYDILDSNKKSLVSPTFMGREAADNFEHMLKTFCPQVELKPHRVLG